MCSRQACPRATPTLPFDWTMETDKGPVGLGHILKSQEYQRAGEQAAGSSGNRSAALPHCLKESANYKHKSHQAGDDSNG